MQFIRKDFVDPIYNSSYCSSPVPTGSKVAEVSPCPFPRSRSLSLLAAWTSLHRDCGPGKNLLRGCRRFIIHISRFVASTSKTRKLEVNKLLDKTWCTADWFQLRTSTVHAVRHHGRYTMYETSKKKTAESLEGRCPSMIIFEGASAPSAPPVPPPLLQALTHVLSNCTVLHEQDSL